MGIGDFINKTKERYNQYAREKEEKKQYEHKLEYERAKLDLKNLKERSKQISTLEKRDKLKAQIKAKERENGTLAKISRLGSNFNNSNVFGSSENKNRLF